MQAISQGETTDMPRAPTRPAERNTLRSIILGLLGARAMTGYDIKRAFDRTMATYWNAGASQIYTSLKVMETQGLVSSEIVPQEGRPDRRVYHLTVAGRRELDEWLSEPVPARFTKDEFLTKLFFCGQTSDEEALRHLERHRDTLRAQLADMERVLQTYGNRPARRPRLLEYQLLVRDFKQASIQTDLDMTERAIARIRERLAPGG
ncbi:MAG TPA: PadR family transcriptional regulator [Ktedonobacterales bacterium]|nr:PadR family transcriptional regulator [Ktedonobacterales bacterium]